MKILHGTWIPSSGDEFIQGGNFYLWVETDEPSKQQQNGSRHPQQLNKADLSKLLLNELGLGTPKYGSMLGGIVTKYFMLPSTETQPQPSLELTRYLEADALVPTTWKMWSIECFQVNSIVKLLNDLHFLCLYGSSEIQLGSDLLFWYHYSQSVRELLQKDRYIPALRYREIPAPKRRDGPGRIKIVLGVKV